jgi:hypothetical protein
MRIVYLEDNPIQAESMLEEFRRWLPLETRDILFVKTEAEFMSRLNEIEAFDPTVAVLDVMVIWCSPRPNMPQPPQNVLNEGYYMAGARCAEALCSRLPELPIVFYTIVEGADLQFYLNQSAPSVKGAVILPKSSDPKVLIDQLKLSVHRSSGSG